MKSQNKLLMLTEYEKQITSIFANFKNNKITFEKLISQFNRLNEIWNISRVDIKNFGNAENTVKFIEYDQNANIAFPKWFSDKSGKGCKIEWTKNDLNFIFKCISKGTLKISLKGIDFRDFSNNKVRLPVYINFNRFVVNEDIIFEEDLVVWHNNSYTFEKLCENEEIIYIDLEFETIFDFFPQLQTRFNPKSTHDEMQTSYENIKKYIQNEKQILYAEINK